MFVIVFAAILLLFLLKILYFTVINERRFGYDSPAKLRFYPPDGNTRLYRPKSPPPSVTRPLQKCRLSESNLSCCGGDSEYRCVHMNREFKVVHPRGDADIEIATYPPNENVYEGYCVESSFKTNADAKRLILRPQIVDECNPNTAERVVFVSSRRGATTTMSYKIGCVCKRPDIITQKIPFESDCDIPVACAVDGGRLTGGHWWNRAVHVDIVDDLSCENCPVDAFPDRDPVTRRPLCRRRRYAELSVDDTASYPDGFPLIPLTHPAIEPAFVDKFDRPEERRVPDPCAFDIFTLKPFTNGECRLAENENGTVYFCKSDDIAVATIQIDDDYLLGNAGKWSNGCFRYTEDTRNVAYAVAEFYNVPPLSSSKEFPHPVIGYALKKSALVSSAFKNLDTLNVE